MRVLGIETSCDETGVAIYETGRGLLGHRLHSQIDLHAAYGGVVPELASRDHIRRLPLLLRETLEVTGLTMADIDAVAYTAHGLAVLGMLRERRVLHALLHFEVVGLLRFVLRDRFVNVGRHG